MSARPFLYVATPAYGGRVYTQFIASLLALQTACERRGVGLHVEMAGGDALINRVRARLAADFLTHPEATHLLFCDADIGFAPENVFRLLDSGKDVVAGVCPLKQIDWDKARKAAKADVADLQAVSIGYVVRFIPTPDNSVEVENGIAKVAYGGTGFLMISRDAMTRVVKAHPELRATLTYGPGQPEVAATMVFEPIIEPGTGQHLSEDYAFCRRWRELGGEIWADMESTFTHVGHTAYTGALIKALRPG